VNWPIFAARFLVLALLLAAGPLARAESAFEFSYPHDFGRIPAATYDARGTRIGDANVAIETLEDGGLRMTSLSSSREGARTIATAWFAPVEATRTVRLVRQESSSLDAGGRALGHLVVDHEARVGTCTNPEDDTAQQVELPSRDRVVNVPMNLLFLPLVRGEAQTLEFQLFLCRDGARVMNFEAWVKKNKRASERPIEVRYAPDFGAVVSMIARNFAPRLSFWFNANEPHEWMGHRLPLYSGGPEVLVIRDGVPAGWLSD
jgi:hypothetical protein